MDASKKKSVFVAMSGGVDSSVAALLLRNEGYEVTGVFMRCFNLDGCAERDAEDARRVAEKIGMPFYVWDFEEDYKKLVVDYMVRGYREGITPNPDVMCNKEIKFGIFLKRALASGADYVATGHYVSLRPLPGTAVRSLQRLAPAASRSNDASFTGDQAHWNSESFPNEDLAQFGLYEAKDKNKDQSYFLWTLTREQLERCLFPIGDYLKSEVRGIARRAGLPTAEKKDSQGICFLGKIPLGDFLKQYIPERRGELLTAAGEKIGEHSGAEFCTIGQRHLGVKHQASGVKGRRETQPFYVAEKNVSANTVVVAEGSDNPALYKKEIHLVKINLLGGRTSVAEPLPVFARVRYRQPHSKAVLTGTKLIFDEPQKFVAAGQSAVFYALDRGGARAGSEKNHLMLGGGVILN